jgi:hypothetical protein
MGVLVLAAVWLGFVSALPRSDAYHTALADARGRRWLGAGARSRRPRTRSPASQGAARPYHSVFVADTVREVRRDAQPPERSSDGRWRFREYLDELTNRHPEYRDQLQEQEAALTYTWFGTPLGHVEGRIIRLHVAVENEDGKTIVLS